MFICYFQAIRLTHHLMIILTFTIQILNHCFKIYYYLCQWALAWVDKAWHVPPHVGQSTAAYSGHSPSSDATHHHSTGPPSPAWTRTEILRANFRRKWPWAWWGNRVWCWSCPLEIPLRQPKLFWGCQEFLGFGCFLHSSADWLLSTPCCKIKEE